MAHRIRRHSMEHLELYDLEKLTPDHKLPPPLPPPRKYRQHLPADFAFQKYQFLCDMTRHQADPVYAATPMFKTILPVVRMKYRRQVFGYRIPSRIIKPISSEAAESENAKADEKEEEEEEEEESSEDDDDEDSESDDDNDDFGGGEESSSSSSSSDDNNLDDDDNDNKRGIVEQIFNRNKR